MIGGFRDSAEVSCPRIRLWKCLEEISMPQFQHKHSPKQGGPVPSSTEMLVYERADRSWFEVTTLQTSWLQQELQELVLHLVLLGFGLGVVHGARIPATSDDQFSSTSHWR